MLNKKNVAEARLHEKIVLLVAQQASNILLPIILSGSIIAFLAYTSSALNRSLVITWYIAFIFVIFSRGYLLQRLPNIDYLAHSDKLNVIAALNFLYGATLGFSVVFMPVMSDVEATIQAMLLVGLSIGGVATLLGFYRILLPFIVPILIPLCIAWFFRLQQVSGLGVTGILFPGLILVFLLIVASLGKQIFKIFQESFEIRLEQVSINQKLQKALNSAEQANRAKTQFLAAASHDLRQPIHALLMFDSALQLQKLDSKSRDIAKSISLSVKALAAQLDALLDISKLDAGVVDVEPVAFKLQRLMGDLAKEFLPLAKEKNIELIFEYSKETILQSDPFLLKRILQNILANAIKYTHIGGVRFRYFEKDQECQFVIEDTGEGIPEEEMQRVFEEFYQINNSQRDRTKGLGLGLSIVKRLSLLLDIQVKVSSELAQGTKFQLVLPADARTMLPVINHSVYDAEKDHYLVERLNILLIDDDVEVARSVQAVLSMFSNKVTVVDSSSAALAAVKACRPDIVLSDLRLKDQDNGLRAIEKIKGIYPDMPAILITGDTAPDKLQQAKLASIELLHKPLTFDQLRKAIYHTMHAA